MSAETVGNFAHFRLTWGWGLLLTLICQSNERLSVFIQDELSESQIKNSEGKISLWEDIILFTDTVLKRKKKKIPGRNTLSLHGLLITMPDVTQSWFIFICKMNSFCTNCTLCINNVCFVHWLQRVSHKSLLPPREVFQCIYDFGHKCPLQALQDVF